MTESQAPRLVAFVNPGAGAGRTERRLRSFLDARPHLGGRTRVVLMSRGESTRTAVREMQPDEIPAAAGGDGTVCSVARALRREGRIQVPLGVIPLGTGNTFAWSVGISSLEDAAAALTGGDRLSVDVMVTSDPEYPLVLVSLSAGFESCFMRSVAGASRWRRHLRAPVALVRGAVQPDRGIELEVDGRTVVTGAGKAVFNAGLYNTPYYGRGRVVIRAALLTDGVAEAVVHDNRRSYVRSLARGVPAPSESGSSPQQYRWTTACIKSAGGMQLDGESVDRGRFDVRLEPRGLTVLVPGTRRGRGT